MVKKAKTYSLAKKNVNLKIFVFKYPVYSSRVKGYLIYLTYFGTFF